MINSLRFSVFFQEVDFQQHVAAFKWDTVVATLCSYSLLMLIVFFKTLLQEGDTFLPLDSTGHISMTLREQYGFVPSSTRRHTSSGASEAERRACPILLTCSDCDYWVSQQHS